MRKSVVRRTAALSGTGLVASLLLVAPLRAEARTPAVDVVRDAAVAVSAELATDGVTDYWTRERMESAVPLDLDADGDPITGAGPAPGGVRARTTLTAPRSVGKLFFTTAQGNAVCSAAAVNTAQKNVVITAGHCVNSGGVPGLLGSCRQGAYFSNFMFVPRYTNGSAPDGRWVGTRAVTHQQWIARCDAFDYDQALIEVAPRSGRRLVDVVGGNGLALNYPARESDVSVWGWPAQAPYDGETVRRCTGSTSSLDSSGDAFIKCPLTGGASGGPWFLGMLNANVGYLWAVTSRRTTSGTPYLLAHPLGNSVKTLLEDARVNSRATRYEPVTARWSARAGLAVRVLRPGVGRGQYVRLRAKAAPRTALVLEVRFSLRRKWSRVTVIRTNSAGVVDWSQRASRVGYRWYRVRVAKRASTATRAKVYPCPLPYVRTASVVDATACTGPAL